MINALRKVLKTAGNISCILAAMVIIAALLMMFVHIRPAVIVSGSMEPVIHTGSMVFIDSDYADVSENDIIAFETGGVLVTHRVVGITDEGYVTKGDANESEDPGLLPESALRGRVIMWVPWIGYAVKILGTPAGLTAAAAFAFGLMLLYWLTGKEVGTDGKKENTDPADSPSA